MPEGLAQILRPIKGDDTRYSHYLTLRLFGLVAKSTGQ
jgi:hypothetical protein